MYICWKARVSQFALSCFLSHTTYLLTHKPYLHTPSYDYHDRCCYGHYENDQVGLRSPLNSFSARPSLSSSFSPCFYVFSSLFPFHSSLPSTDPPLSNIPPTYVITPSLLPSVARLDDGQRVCGLRPHYLGITHYPIPYSYRLFTLLALLPYCLDTEYF